jgi:hypothetical protein
MPHPDLTDTFDSLRTAFAERLGASGRDLAATVRKAGRRLPRRLRPAAATMVEAERMAANPRLARLIDAARIDQAATDLKAWLGTQDAREQRKTRLINMAALIAFNLLVVAGLVVVFLVWRGIV